MKIAWTNKRIIKLYLSGVSVTKLMERSGKTYAELQVIIRRAGLNGNVSPHAKNRTN